MNILNLLRKIYYIKSVHNKIFLLENVLTFLILSCEEYHVVSIAAKKNLMTQLLKKTSKQALSPPKFIRPAKFFAINDNNFIKRDNNV